MLDWTVPDVAAGITALVAVAQALGAAWRDTGILTLCAVGATLVLTRGEPSVFTAAILLFAVGIAAVGWMRGGRHGVGRPGLDGMGMAVVAACALVPFVIADHVPPALRERFVEVALVALGLTASVGLALCLERPGPRRRRPRFFRRIPVVDRESDAPDQRRSVS